MVSYEGDQEGFSYLHDMMGLGEGEVGLCTVRVFRGWEEFK